MDTHTLASITIRAHHQRTERANRTAWMLAARRDAEESTMRQLPRRSRLAEARALLCALVAPRGARLDPSTTRR